MKLKKLLPLLLALMMLSALAVAEPAAAPAGPQPYTHPRHQYVITPPEGWLLYDQDVIAASLEAAKAGETDLGPEAIAVLEDIAPSIEGDDIALFISPAGKGNNVNVVFWPVDSMPTTEQLMNEAPPILHEQYKQIFPTVQFVDPGSQVNVGGIESLRVAYTHQAAENNYEVVQYYVYHNNAQAILTFTWVNPTEEERPTLDAIEQQVRDSFQMPSA